MPRKIPKYEQLDEDTLYKTSELSFQNAKQYYEDAELLFQKGSYGHSLALSALGMEELAKSMDYFNVGFTKVLEQNTLLGSSDEIAELMNNRMKTALTNHGAKQKEAHRATMAIQWMVKMIAELMKTPIREMFTEHERMAMDKIDAYIVKADENEKNNAKLIENLDKYKLIGMYVDIQTPSGEITGPNCITKGDTEGYLKMLNDYVAIWEIFQFSETIKDFWKLMDDPQSPLNIYRRQNIGSGA